jgi:hypothetical protein
MTGRHHEVPTHLMVEDRVLFGLTVRQFLHVLVGCSAAYAAWDQLAPLAEVVRATLVALALITGVAFALVKPGGRALEEWLLAAVMFAGAARSATWQPHEPDAADWRPADGQWQELAPSLTWAEDDGR